MKGIQLVLFLVGISGRNRVCELRAENNMLVILDLILSRLLLEEPHVQTPKALRVAPVLLVQLRLSKPAIKDSEPFQLQRKSPDDQRKSEQNL